MKLNDRQIDLLETLVHFTGWPVDEDVRPARVLDLGGWNGSYHGSCIARLHKKGLCDRDGYFAGCRRVNFYLPNERTIEVLRDQSKRNGPWGN